MAWPVFIPLVLLAIVVVGIAYQAFIEATALAVSAATMVIGTLLAVMTRYQVPARIRGSG